MGRKGQKLVADILGPEDTKTQLRKNTDMPTESVTSVSVSQDWKIQTENRCKMSGKGHKLFNATA